MNKPLYLLQVLVMAVMSVTAGCGTSIVAPSTPDLPELSGRVHESNTVSIKYIQPGDKIAGLLVASMEYIDDYNFTVSFSGQLTLSGRYQHFYSEYTSAPEVMFWVDEASRQKLPQILEDARGEQSHFTLYPHARFAPLGSQGTATVVIDQYRLVSRERGGETNSGRLVRLVQKRR